MTGEPIEMIHQPAAHTDGDLMVFFRKSDVISAGDVFSTDGYPVIDAKRGGTLSGVLDGLNRLIDIAIPEFNSMGGTRVIPGHGRICNEIDLVEYRDAMTIIADRITQLVLEGKTLEQVKAAGVSLDYDGVYGATSGPWTTDMFVEAVYREIKANTAPWKARLLRNVPAAELAFLQHSAAPAGARKSAAAHGREEGQRRSAGRQVGAQLFDSNYEPSSLLPYRREMIITINGDEMHARSLVVAPAAGQRLAAVVLQLHGQARRQAIPDSQLGQGQVALKRVDANTIERTLDGDGHRQGDVDVDAVGRSEDADGRREGDRRDRRRVHDTQVYEKQ